MGQIILTIEMIDGQQIQAKLSEEKVLKYIEKILREGGISTKDPDSSSRWFFYPKHSILRFDIESVDGTIKDIQTFLNKRGG